MNDEDEIVLVRQIRKGYEGFLREFQRLVPGKSGGTPAKDLGPRGGESLIEGMLIPAKKLLALEEGLVVRSKQVQRTHGRSGGLRADTAGHLRCGGRTGGGLRDRAA